ncbi:hypothetical protein KFE25_008957 [Diacronema lutheri]|uniref:Fatty acid hydroxylase domain-containing protein n=1 Tax=Diacronema lutheri TaxID=2081491 RepID=A0A8J5XWW3_DIALT|nr:hypothetical protein KFE25_008957 [Diacronema lutheri]
MAREASSWATKLSRFALVNGLVSAVAACAWASGQTVRHRLLGLWLGSCVRCALSIATICALTRGGRPLGNRKDTLGARDQLLICAKVALYFAPVDALVLSYAAWTAPATDALAPPSSARSVATRCGVFVLVSFLWELAFDFCHYWVHRACHASTLLYQLVHKTHHQHRSPSPLTTYDHSPLDVLASNALPAMLAFALLSALRLPLVGEAERQLLFAYKSYVEVGGHSGVDARPRSFPQFVWLPAMIPCLHTADGYAGIAGHTREHHWHHAVLRCNYSKRFRVWDVVFGTYEFPAPSVS